jgi:hypothetical protein
LTAVLTEQHAVLHSVNKPKLLDIYGVHGYKHGCIDCIQNSEL